MTSPVVEARATSTTTSNQTSHTINLPTGIVAGERLLVCVATDGVPGLSGTLHTTYDVFDLVQHSSNSHRMWTYTRIADGTEGSTVGLTTGNSQHVAAIAFRISGGGDLDKGAASGTEGADANPDSGEVTPTGGAKDYLWISLNATDGGRASTAAPTNYINLQTGDSGAATDGVGIGSAERSLNAAAEDPGTFTIDASDQWVGRTIAVHPAAAAGDATVTPGVIAVTASMPSVSPSASSTVSPAPITVTTSMPSASLSAGSTVTPGVIAVVASLPAATVDVGGAHATVTPATISVVAALPAVSLSASSSVSPSPIAVVVTLPTPFIFIPTFRFLFTPPTHEVVAWEMGRDDKNKRADPVWRHFDRGDRGKTVVRTNGEYRTVVNPLHTDLEAADDIRLPDGTIGKAVFLGGHINEVTSAIKDELVAAGYSVESEEV